MEWQTRFVRRDQAASDFGGRSFTFIRDDLAKRGCVCIPGKTVRLFGLKRANLLKGKGAKPPV